MSIEMNKSPMEIKCEEMAEKHLKMLVPQDSPTNMRAREFKAGFKAALDLPEVRALVDALLEIRQGQDSSAKTYQTIDMMRISRDALKAWNSFKGE